MPVQMSAHMSMDMSLARVQAHVYTHARAHVCTDVYIYIYQHTQVGVRAAAVRARPQRRDDLASLWRWQTTMRARVGRQDEDG